MKKSFTKPSIVMKICAAQTIIAMIICGVSAAHDNYAQLLDKKVTLSLKDVPLEVALKKIESASKVRIFYSIDQLDLNESISIEAKDETLRVVLDDLLSPHNIKYKVNERKRAIILKKQTDLEPSDETSFIELLGTSEMQLEPFVITGTILDATTQLPMAGVNIILKGTTVGTTTDSEGNYSVQAGNNDILVFSFIGYVTVETQVAGRSVIDVSLREDVKSLNEVVVNAGYYKTTRELQTGSIVKIDADDIDQQPVANPLAALQGRVPGLEIIQANGVPGGNFKVRIRGTNSLSSGNDPLYIVDGVPYTSTPMSFTETAGNILGGSDGSHGSSPLNSINPSDIESIEVLKDADATAIYGSRGANGVILITTKKGHPGKTNVDLNFYSGVAKVGHRLNLLSTSDYVTMRKEAFQNEGIVPNPSNAQDLLVWDTTNYRDWQKELIGGSAHINDARLSISGGEKQTQFLIGAGFHKETTVFPGTNYNQRFSLLSSITNTSHDQKLKTTLSLNVSRNRTDMVSKDLTFPSLFLPPNAPSPYDENGQLNWQGWSSSIENPFALLKRRYESNTNNLIANGTVAYAFLPNLEAKVNIGFTTIQRNDVTTQPISSVNPAEPGKINRSIFGRSDFNNWIVEPQLNWKSNVGAGTIDVLAGATFLDQTSEGLVQYANDFTSEALMRNLGSALTIISATNLYSQYRYQAFFGRANYTLKDRYVINLTGRRDGSSRFGPGKQFAVFGALGAAWVFSKEDFIKSSMPFISFGKLKGSYGTTGNDQIGDYQYLDSYTSSGIYQQQIGLYPARLYNPDFAWEINRKLEISMDLGFMNDRITLGTSFYHNRSSNQLVGFPLAPTTGFTNIQGNFPAVIQNSGLEFQLTTVNINTTSDFQWSTALNLTIPRNKLISFHDIESSPAYATRYAVEQPLDIVKLYKNTGVDPANGEHRFVDVNSDETYDFNDRTVIEFVGREFYGGLQNSIRFRNFQMDILFQAVKQQGYNYLHLFYSAPGTISNQPEVVMQRWNAQQTDSHIQHFTTQGSSTSQAYSSYLYYSEAAISDASFIRLKNVSLSYSLPKSLTKKLSVVNAVMFVQGQNLFTITNYTGLDPESPGSGILPPLRTLTAGVKLKI